MQIGRTNSNCIRAWKTRLAYCQHCEMKTNRLWIRYKRAISNRAINKQATQRCSSRQVSNRHRYLAAIEILKIKFYQKINSKVNMDPNLCLMTSQITTKMKL
jgi:hypothetical protein